MTQHRRLAAVAAALLLPAVALTGCSSSSTTGSGSGTSSSPSTSASSSAGGEVQYAATDCAKLAAPTISTTPPTGGTTVDGVTVTGTPPAAPGITLSSQAKVPTTLVTKDLVEGTGAEVKPGATVTANYCGVGMITGQIFDSSWARGGTPISFGLDQVIAGWTQGIPGMKVGGERLLIIPGDLGYGAAGNSQAGIQPNEPLVFVVDLTATS